jgi:hypothetical protein
VREAYREAAKRLHPDLSEDEEDRQRRTMAMARLNAAYERANVAAIERILEDTEALGRAGSWSRATPPGSPLPRC